MTEMLSYAEPPSEMVFQKETHFKALYKHSCHEPPLYTTEVSERI